MSTGRLFDRAAAFLHGIVLLPSMFHRTFLPLLLLSALSPAIAFAQQTPAVQPSDQQLRKDFSNGFLKGCIAGKTPGVADQQQYCACLVRSYNTRYDGRTLVVISQLAAQAGQSGPVLVDVMMAPERKTCTARPSV